MHLLYTLKLGLVANRITTIPKTNNFLLLFHTLYQLICRSLRKQQTFRFSNKRKKATITLSLDSIRKKKVEFVVRRIRRRHNENNMSHRISDTPPTGCLPQNKMISLIQ